MNLRRTLAIVSFAALTVAACGGDDDAAPAATTAVTTAPAGESEPTADDATGANDVDDTGDAAAPTGDEVDPTIAPDLPPTFLAGVGPLAAIGDPLPELPEDGDDPAVGMAAPILVGESFDGERVRLDPGTDGPTWIVFLAHWCPHCNDEIPVINELAATGGIPDGIEVVGVSTAVNPERPNFPPGEWLDDRAWAFTSIADGVDTERGEFIAAVAYGVSGFPFSVLVDGDGIVQERWSGGRELDELATLLTNNLALS